MIEPHIVINERTLTVAQAMTLRVAAAAFAFELRENGLGDDEHGKQMTALYLARLDEIIGLMVGERREAGMNREDIIRMRKIDCEYWKPIEAE